MAAKETVPGATSVKGKSQTEDVWVGMETLPWRLTALTFQILLVTWCTNKFNIKQLYALPTQHLGVLYLSQNSDLCHLQYKLFGFYNRYEVFTARYGLGL